MKIKDGFVLRRVGDNHVVVPVGIQTVDFRCIITLNDTGAFIWEQLQNPCTPDEIVTALLAEYDVDRERAEKSVDAFVARLKELDFLA